MPLEQSGFKRISGFGIVAAFGLVTMSSNVPENSVTSMNVNPPYYYEASGYVYSEEPVCSSSMLSEQAIGDIISVDTTSDFVQTHEKLKVNLQITKISKHVSNFDFDDEYEEI